MVLFAHMSLDVEPFLSAECGFMLVARNTFWTDLFRKYFIEAPQDEQKDDMLFYVRKSTAKSKFQIPQVRISNRHVSIPSLVVTSFQIYVC